MIPRRSLKQAPLELAWQLLIGLFFILLWAGIILSTLAFLGVIPKEMSERVVQAAPILFGVFVLWGILSIIRTTGRDRIVLALGLLVILPVGYFLVSFIATPLGLQSVNSLELPDGRQLIVSQSGDVSPDYTLWQYDQDSLLPYKPVKSVALGKLRGPIPTKPFLILSPDEKRVLVRRGPAWTDCIELQPRLRNCPGIGLELPEPESDAWFARSDVIERLAGVSPEDTFVSDDPKFVSWLQLPDNRSFAVTRTGSNLRPYYKLWHAEGSENPQWQPLEEITLGLAVGVHQADPRLISSPDGKWLLVRRGGAWTDCIELKPRLRNCPGFDDNLPEPESDAWFARSDAIERLTGLTILPPD